MSKTVSRLLRRIEHAAGGVGLTALFVVVWVLNVAISIVVALVMLFEEWGWEPLHRAIAALAKFRPVAALAAMIARLPPYGALIVFAVPVVLLIPVKLSALYLLASGHPVLAIELLIAAKLVGTGLVAWIYQITYPQLMQIAWVKQLHDHVLPWKEAMFARVRASWAWRWGRLVKAIVRRRIERAWAQLSATKPAT